MDDNNNDMENVPVKFVKRNFKLIDAIKSGDMNEVKNIIENEDVNLDDNSIMSPIHNAVMHNNVEALNYFFEIGGSSKLESSDGSSLLTFAESKEMIDALAKHIDLNYKNKEGKTATMYFAQHNNVECLEAMCQAGAELEVVDNQGYTAYRHAKDMNNSEALQVLESFGASVSTESGLNKTKLMHYIEQNSYYSVVDEVKTSDVDAKDINGRTAVMYWAMAEVKNEKYFDGGILSALKVYDADFNARDNDGKTALMHALDRHQTVEALLESHRVDVNVQDNDGKTALMLVVEQGNVDSFKKLIGEQYHNKIGSTHINGVLMKPTEFNLDIQDNDGKTTFDYIKSSNNPSIIKMAEDVLGYVHVPEPTPEINRIESTGSEKKQTKFQSGAKPRKESFMSRMINHLKGALDK